MKSKIVHFLVSLLLGIGMIWAFLSIMMILPTMAQELDCTTVALELCETDSSHKLNGNSFISRWQQISPEKTLSPEQVLAESYQRVVDAGAYEFSANSEQTLLPRPLPNMIGQTDLRVDMAMEGEVTMPDYSRFSLSLDGAGLDPTPMAMIREGTQSFLLREGEKIPVENPVGLASPTGDFAGYLAAAENVAVCESDASPFADVAACYTFDVNGPRFAEHVRSLMQAQVNSAPDIVPPGATPKISSSPMLVNMSGQGKVWLDINGLPLRQTIDMRLPELNDYYDADVRMIINYRFGAEAIVAVQAAEAARASFLSLPSVDRVKESAQESLPNLFIFVFFLAISAIILILWRRRWVYSFVAIFLTLSFLAAPVLQIIGYDLYVNRKAYAANAASFAESISNVEVEQPEVVSALENSLAASAATAVQTFTPDVYCGLGGNGDRDGDMLADDAEYCLGTDPNLKDSDHDGIDDGQEVFGFQYGKTVTQTWYSDPLNPDSNGDGRFDAQEWPSQTDIATADLDNDGLPNLWDNDDDGDGVSDSLDLSPASRTNYITSTKATSNSATTTNSFNFSINGAYNGYIYLDFQVQPHNLDHLRYGVTSLDWGADFKGQMQDHNASTDDLQLIPMLSVETNLPPSRDLAEEYHATPFTTPDKEGYSQLLLPLNIVGSAGSVETFGARVAYGPETLATLDQSGIRWRNAKIVWIVQAKIDSENGKSGTTEKTMPILTYEEPSFRITGWQVTKSGPFESAILGTPSMPNDDRQLFQLLFGLSDSFLTHQFPDLDEVTARFSGANTPAAEKWGVTTTVAIDLPVTPYRHFDEGIQGLDSRIKTFLSDNYPWDSTSVFIIASQSQMGVYGQDNLQQFEPAIDKLSANLANIPLVTQHSLDLQMRDGWKMVTDGNLAIEVMDRSKDAVNTAVTHLKDQYPNVTASELMALVQSFYVTWEGGRIFQVQADGINNEAVAKTDQQIYERIYAIPRDRYNDPENIATLPGYLVEVGNFAQKGSGLIFAGGAAQTWQYLRANAEEARIMGFTAATPNFINSANDAIHSGMGGEVTFTEDGTKWNDVREHAGNAFFGAKAYGASKGMILNVMGTVDAIYDVYSKASKVSKVGVALLVLDIALTILAFGLNGDFSGQAIAMLIATIVVSIALFAISLIPVVGWVIAAIIGLIDFILTLIFDDFTLTGWVGKHLANYFYQEEPLTQIKEFDLLERDMTLLDENLGYVVGNRFRITDTFEGVIEIVPEEGFSLDADKLEEYGAAAIGGGAGIAIKAADEFDLMGRIQGGPSNAESLRKSWICGEFVISGFKAEGNTCPFPDANYKLDTIPTNAPDWTYSNPMSSTITFLNAGNDIEIPIDVKVTALTRWDVSIPVPPIIPVAALFGRIHWQKDRKITLPNDLPDEDQEEWTATPLYIDVLPATVQELWHWGYSESILTNHDPDGDGMSTKAEITAWLGSKGYSDIQTFFKSYIQSSNPDDLDRFLANWDKYEELGDAGKYGITNFCTTYPSLSGLCDVNSSPPWLTWDYDGDGLSDKFEFENSGGLGTNFQMYDTDGDGLHDGFEYQIGTQINAKDSDGDGLNDDIEVYHPTTDGSWTGGWEIELPEYGPVGPNGRTTITVRVFSDPLVKDTDGDGITDLAEKQNGTSPTAYNRAPRVSVTGQPTAVSPQGVSAIYVRPGNLITLTTNLSVFPPYTVSSTMELKVPGGAFSFPTTTGLIGSRWVPNTGVTFTPRWNFANNVVQPWEYLNATTTSTVPYISSSVVTTATVSLPFGNGNQRQEDSQLIVVDAENPHFSFMTPAHGELIGGGVSSYVIGGISNDPTTWVKQISLDLPNIGTQTITNSQNFSPWAYTWELPSDGIYTLYGRATDFVGNISSNDDVQVMIDNSPPTVDVNLVDGAVFGKPENSSVITITLSGTASENLSGLTRVQISTDGGPWREVWTLDTANASNTTFVDHNTLFTNRAVAATWDAVWTLPNVESVQGYHSLRIRAFDQAGNWPTYLERNIIVDVIPPTDDLLNQAYLFEFPHVVANENHTFQGVANDVGNVPQPSRPAELVGALDSINDATIWLGLNNIDENDGGVNVAWIGDFNGDRRGDLLVGLPAAEGGAGRVAVVYGRSGNWPVPNEQEMLAEAKTSFIGLPGAGLGAVVEPAGDVNGDGLADLLIGDPANNRIFLIFGQNQYLGNDLLLDKPQAGSRVEFFVPDGQLIGQNVGAAGDVNGDGKADLIIGATGTVNQAYLIMGQSAGWTGTVPADRFAAVTITNAGSGTLSGVGDVDGDFRDEFAVGRNNTLYLFAGKGSYAPQAGYRLSLSSGPVTTFASNNAAPETAALGDVNGDNIDDFIYTSGTSQVLVLGDSSLDASWATQTYGYGVGFLAAPGDVDNDGLNDILIGGNETAYLILGSNTGQAQAVIAGVAAAASAPYAAGADLNSDGSSDLLLVPTATSSQAAATASEGITDLPPTWVPRLPEATLDTFVGSTTWPAVDNADAYVNADGVCYGLTPCYTTIQTAVDAWNDDDLIIVQPGVYEPFIIDGYSHSYNRITVRGTNPDAVIIDGSGSSYAARINMATGVRLENMTLRNASYGVQLDSAGINGHETPSYRTVLDHLLIYDTAAHDVYMSRNSTVSVVNSTLARGSQQVGAYGSADPNVVVQWNSMAPSDWPVMDGGGAVLVGDTIYVGRGGGNQAFGRYYVPGDYWYAPWGPDNVYEENSVIAAGSDNQVYLLGAPAWKDVGVGGWWIELAEGGQGALYAMDTSNSTHVWNGVGWSAIPGSPGNCHKIAAHPVNGDLYCLDYIQDMIVKWDGTSWSNVAEVTDFDPLNVIEMAIDSGGNPHVVGNISMTYWNGDSCYGYQKWSGSSWSCEGTFTADDSIIALAIDSNSNTVYVGGDFSNEYASNITTIGGGTIEGVTGPVNGIDVDDEGAVYVAGMFTSTMRFGAIDQGAPAGIASWRNGTWTTYPEIYPEAALTWPIWGYDIAATSGGDFYAVGLWDDQVDSTQATETEIIYWNGSSWERLGSAGNSSNNEVVKQVVANERGVFIQGDFQWIDHSDGTLNASYAAALQFSHEVYSTTANAWFSNLVGAPMALGDGASYAGDEEGNLVLLVGGGHTDSFKYSIDNNSWTRVGDMPHPVNASAMTLGENGNIYAVTDGSSSFYRFDGSSWTAVGPTISGATIDDGVALTYDSHSGSYYVLPGGNGATMLRYNSAWGSSWETLPADRNTPAGVRPGAALVFVAGEDENRLFTPQGNYANGSSTAFWMYPLPMPNKVEFTDSIIYGQSGTSWLNYNDPLPEDFNFRIDENTLFFGGAGWSPTNQGTLPETSADPFLDAARDLYRMGEPGYTIGYHTYTEPMTATTDTGIQAAINSGANTVIVKPGIYEEAVYLVNGVSLIGTNPDWTIIRPLNNSTATALVRAAGINGASLSRFTLDGENSGLDGLSVTGNAANITLQRALIYDTETAILIDGAGSDVEVAHATVAQNNNGLVATNCASVDVRNAIFAYSTSSGLSHESCAAVKLHTYNLYWANASDFGADADAGAAELFLDPNFVDPMDHDYRTLNFSPIIDAGNPTDPAPPGAGSRADLGYIEQGRVNFYVDNNYCEACLNDGLTWQVDAFDTIQDALNAAQGALENLNPSFAAVPRLVVGVAPGVYNEQIIVPSHVLLVGSGAEQTTIDGNGGTAVSFQSVTNAGLRDVTLLNADTAVAISGASNSINIERNVIRNNAVGISLASRATADLEYNTLVNNNTGILADGSGSWAALMHNIISGSDTGLMALNNGQLFTDYNLYFNTIDFSSVTSGEHDIVGQAPLFAGGDTPYRLSPSSPALDAASPFATVPNGGGLYADLGYSELLAAPITLLLGQEDLSTVMGNSGVAVVEYGVMPIPDPTAPVTETIPVSWTPIDLDTPGETYSYWRTNYMPLEEGLYRFYSRATDMVGNTEEDELDWYDGSFVVDSTAPTVTWLAPLDGASLEAPLELRAQVTDYAAGEFSVEEKDVYFEVDGQRYPATWAAEPWDAASGEPRVFRAWISPTVGLHSGVVAGAEDKAGNGAEDNTLSFTVTGVSSLDITPPVITPTLPVDGGWVTRTVTFSGTVTDLGSGIASVEVSVDGGATWRPASVTGSDWSLIWEGPEDQPLISYPAAMRATDSAGNSSLVTLQFTVDEVRPSGLTPVTFDALQGSHFDQATNLAISWQPALDASGLVTTFLTMDQFTDTIPVDVVTGTTAVFNLNSNGDWYAHLAAIDAAGNATLHHFGPWHVGINDGLPFAQRQQSIIIDGYVDVAHNEWQLDTEYLDDDERTIGSEVTYSPEGQQAFLTAWDANNYFMAWRGGGWTLDGDLWIYLKAGGSGSNELIAPLASAPDASLPFAANYAVHITGPLTGTLYEFNDGWRLSAEEWTFAYGSTGDTEIRLPLFGTIDVEMLAFGLGDDANVWAIFPATNPLNPGTTVPSAARGLDMTAPAAADGWVSYQWADVTAVTNVADGQPLAVGLELSLDSVQAPQAPWGPGSTLEYVIHVNNLESEAVSGQQILLTASPDSVLIHDSITGATCSTTSPWNCTLATLAPGLNAITLTTHLAADLSGLDSVTLTASLTDSNIPVELATQDSLAHQLDGTPPVVTVQAPPFVSLGSYTFEGTASDGNGAGVAYVEVRSQFGSWQRAEGTEYWTADLTVSPFAQHGDTWQFEVRAADLHGQASNPQLVTFTVDLLGPTVTFNSPAELSGSMNEIMGTITEVPNSSQAAEVMVQLDDEPWREAVLFAPDATSGEQLFLWTWNMPTEDGVSHTLRVQTVDTVGNTGSLSPLQTVWVDNVTPVITVTEVLTQVAMQHYYPGAQIGDPVLAGSVTDGTAVDSVAIWVELPNGTSYVDTAVLNANAWEYVPSLQALGNYKLQVRAMDTLGNQTQTSYYTLEVLAAPDAGPNTFYTAEDTPISFEPLLDDIDLDSDTIFLEAVQDPANGTATISGTSGIIYTPTLNFNGLDVFSYTASDGQFTDSATVTVTVLPVNDPPIIDGADIITATMDEDSGTLAFNFSGINVDDDTLIWTVDEGMGTAVISNTYGIGNLNADIAYTPELDFDGIDSFRVRLSDGEYMDEVTVQVTVTPVDDAPRAADDYLVIVPSEGGKPINIPVLANDAEVDGQTLLLAGVGTPSKGSTAAVNGSVVRYTPSLTVGETETVSYTVSDGGLTDMAVLYIKMVAGEISGERGETISASGLGQNNSMKVTLTIPANVISGDDQVTFVLRETAVTGDPPQGTKFAGLAFALEPYVDGVLTASPFVLNNPIIVTIEYSDADMAHIGRGDDELMLNTWSDGQWLPDGITLVERDTVNNRLVVSIAHLSDFALFGTDMIELYVPMVIKP